MHIFYLVTVNPESNDDDIAKEQWPTTSELTVHRYFIAPIDIHFKFMTYYFI